MKSKSSPSALALYPIRRGYAYVLFESNESVVDWGVRELRSGARERNGQVQSDAERLMDRFLPDCVVIQDVSRGRSRRAERIRHLCQSLSHAALLRGMDVHPIRMSAVRAAFAPVGAVHHHEIAQAVARMFPIFGHRLPKKRRAWDSEQSVMGVFTATALGIAFYNSQAGAVPGTEGRDRRAA